MASRAQVKSRIPTTLKMPSMLRRSLSTPNLLDAATNSGLTRSRNAAVATASGRSGLNPPPFSVRTQTRPINTINSQNKRPANKENVPPKSKNPKIEKIPDWDYKGRFNQLNQKYTALLQRSKAMEQSLDGLKDLDKLRSENGDYRNELQIVKDVLNQEREEHVKLQNKCEELERSLQKATERSQRLHNENTELHATADHNRVVITRLETDLNETSVKYHTEQTRRVSVENEITQLRCDLLKAEELRRILHNTIQDLKGNIRVFCRVRPPVIVDDFGKVQCSINYIDEQTMEIASVQEIYSNIRGKQESVKCDFHFDKVFMPEATQTEVFEDLSQLVQSALDGYHVCVLAYGQTGSGKTYTMMGSTAGDDPEGQGIIPRVYNMLFERVSELAAINLEYTIEASFLEIYNEVIRDLLHTGPHRNLELFYNNGNVLVKDLCVRRIGNAAEIEALIGAASENRTVAATDYNLHSSRSHAVTKLTVTGVNRTSGALYQGSINLVDLAGSESAKTSRPERLNETRNINKSLSTLGSVMLALYNKDAHVPYRNSKLTYLLQPCLGGNSKTLMIVNVTPFQENLAESLNSLRFASKVKQVKLTAKRCKTVVPSSKTTPGGDVLKSATSTESLDD